MQKLADVQLHISGIGANPRAAGTVYRRRAACHAAGGVSMATLDVIWNPHKLTGVPEPL
jgi:hypothetical protein